MWTDDPLYIVFLLCKKEKIAFQNGGAVIYYILGCFKQTNLQTQRSL